MACSNESGRPGGQHAGGCDAMELRAIRSPCSLVAAMLPADSNAFRPPIPISNQRASTGCPCCTLSGESRLGCLQPRAPVQGTAKQCGGSAGQQAGGDHGH